MGFLAGLEDSCPLSLLPGFSFFLNISRTVFSASARKDSDPSPLPHLTSTGELEETVTGNENMKVVFTCGSAPSSNTRSFSKWKAPSISRKTPGPRGELERLMGTAPFSVSNSASTCACRTAAPSLSFVRSGFSL